jgi:diguanylate cyclase (GGDEF)-like protein
MADVDGFKAINDTYGHSAGDVALQRIAQCLVYAVRAADRIGRVGGDEFLVVLPDTDAAAATSLARRIMAPRRVSLTVDEDEPAVISLSVGAATASPAEPAANVVERADWEMYRMRGVTLRALPHRTPA